MKKLFMLAGVLLVAGSLISGVWAQGNLQEIPPLSPARTLSGSDLRVGDATAPDSPVRVKHAAVSLQPTDLGDVIVEGTGNAGATAVKEKSPDRAIPQAMSPQTRSGDELRLGDATAPDSPVRVVESNTVSLQPTDLGEVTVEGRGNGGVRPEKGKLDAHLEYYQAEIGPLGAIPISGVLNPSVAHLYGPYWYNAGDRVTVSVSWTPGSSPLRIGLTSQQSGIFYGCEVSGGGGSCTARVLQGGWYYPTVWNVGSSTVSYSGYVSW